MFDRKAWMKEYHKKWYKKNKKKVLKIVKKWAKNNPEKRKFIWRKWIKLNSKKISTSNSRWYQNNKEKALSSRRRYHKKRYKSDPTYKLLCCIRGRIISVLSGRIKSAPSLKLLGVDNIEVVWKHLEKTFKPGMTRKNYGKVWEMDHIIPCSSFDLNNPEEQIKCFNYKNLQALTPYENRAKSDKII